MFEKQLYLHHNTEAAAPSGYSRMADYRFQVDDSWSGTAPVLLVNIPDSYAFMKVGADGKPLQGVKFALRDADGNLLQTLESDENGIVRAEHLQNGTYYLQETSPDGRIVEMIEIPEHPWFIATQAHPELKSRPNRPHPLFHGFIEAANKVNR